MLKKTGNVLLLGILTMALLPTTSMGGKSGYHGRAGVYYGGSHGYSSHSYSGYHGGSGYSHGHHDYDDAWLWGVGGVLLGTAIAAATLYSPPLQQNVYAAPPPPQVMYVRPQLQVNIPAIPPGMCRWERVAWDSYGRTVMDQFGQPIIEYTIGPCK
ncbi:hypothetical protein [Desulfopila aestuarii]|uniref:Uncharacterized protein n=1 Tax=Desulfopila aestuarii DSM 18488 TaxID=1121416 RepID=A0A1M7XYP4_9BACT|nr:hypothetical protein [Desulfopila aestuarii]SHO44188.1 hypothetical protein SAMN02745220_00691 [Desulfopila aestuarii DSM 18488]